ncbi:MAG: HAMP domain-containing sensor histidine kinase [Anaerolineales bacterium]|nr:HAMP domain-containing histidine kinase [Anaerolineales bacterium]MCS7249218.1 HAMP domain-containing histidine kinase [Anaerolineales bacterium]MDW8163031.1 HAMP domain-containing sensor histidine kinase [Anaerolineales bacterium]MDW8448204.1 HAMP domain-containing sensor histidine kinase [Anaerolineales bacterium]
MSLRARLALLYTAIVVGILLVFGVAVYLSVSISLTNEIEQNLRNSATRVLPLIYVSDEGELSVNVTPDIEFATDTFIQVWDRNGQLRADSANVRNLTQPLDSASLYAGKPLSTEVLLRTENDEVHLRVLTVPLVLGDRPIGAIQVGASLAVVDATQRSLILVLIVGALLSTLVAGLASWVSTRQALAPLEDITETALQITRADDLSRRIPYTGPPNDEIGQLIHAFNQTLGRLENLFNTQRRFLADVGHELRTPLTVIKGNVDLMRMMKELDKEAMESIESEVERMTRLVGDLLLLSQAESGKLPLHLQVVELDTLIIEVLGQMRVLAKDKVSLELGEMDQVQVCADKDKLKQVFVNLVQNAISYTPKGGRVVVSLRKSGHQALVSVSDNGPGIAPQDLPYIFERFYRGEKSRTRSKDGKGFGLGLSIAYWIVKNHEGSIEVDSKVGEGTTFRVYLPTSLSRCGEEIRDMSLRRRDTVERVIDV